MPPKFRCDCPFTSALDVLGDKWILVIVKQMLVDGLETFKDFRESPEAIASNILSAKLKLLEESHLVFKAKRPDNKKTNLYLLTDKGLALTPILVELANWSDQYLREANPAMQNGPGMAALRADKAAFANTLEAAYREKLAGMEYIVV
ncbi:MAG: helix-turn-helix domain-containing protein [Bacteroidota bacterium]